MFDQYRQQRRQRQFEQALLAADPVALKKALGKGADSDRPFAASPAGPPQTALEHVLEGSSPECLQVLLEAGAQLPQDARGQLRLLSTAISAGDNALALLTLLLRHRLDANAQDGAALFHCLAVTGIASQSLLLSRLLEHGADINARDPQGRSLLHHLLLAEQTELVGTLISAGAELPEALEQLPCSDAIKTFARRKHQDRMIQQQLLGGF